MSTTVTEAAISELEDSLVRILHCTSQLTTEQIWWRPRPEMNAIGNLMLHLAGNVRQWLIAGLSGTPDTRDRPAEFAERRAIPREELDALLQSTVAEAVAVIASSSVRLDERRIVQGKLVTGSLALFRSISHFAGHAQEIIHMTRVQKGESYVVRGPIHPPQLFAPDDPDLLVVSDELTLTPFLESDIPALVEHLANPAISEGMLRMPFPYTTEHGRDWIVHSKSWRDEWGRSFCWAIRTSAGLLIGGIAFRPSTQHPHRAELGYWLASPWWNQGIMTQVIGRVSEEAFGGRNLRKLTAAVFAGNNASARVLQKCGFREEGLSRDHYCKEGTFLNARIFAKCHPQSERND